MPAESFQRATELAARQPDCESTGQIWRRRESNPGRVPSPDPSYAEVAELEEAERVGTPANQCYQSQPVRRDEQPEKPLAAVNPAER
jgi:hypothetical protein